MSDDNTKPILKKCPFCGGNHVNFLEPSIMSRRRRALKDRAIRVACISCRSSTKDFGTYEEAQDAWNKRPEPTKPRIEAACQAIVKSIAADLSPHDIAKAALIAASGVSS